MDVFCFQVIFDTDPAPKGIKKSDQHAIMSQAMIRGMVDEDNDQFVAYFLPVGYNAVGKYLTVVNRRLRTRSTSDKRTDEWGSIMTRKKCTTTDSPKSTTGT